VATALRRIGFASLLLQEKQQAREYLERADQQFTELENQFPRAISYRLDHVATRLQLAQLEQLENNSQAAINQCQAAIAILQIENTLDNGEFDLGVSKLIHSASQMLMSLGKVEAARQLSSRNIAILEQLDDRQVNQSIKAQLLEESRKIAQSANHGI
jgi:hypothetical protein